MQRGDEKRNEENRRKEKQGRIKRERQKMRLDETRDAERRLGNSEAKIRENLNIYLEGRKTSFAVGGI